ncbi:MAG: ComEC/Rec2 family competence protein [Lachnospiraceae bacterium]|nr:ComEC/Rec2 family competence protein [Lachnospiraceae bacterium]
MKRPMVAAAFSWGAGILVSGAQAGRRVNVVMAVAATLIYAIVIIHIVRKQFGSSRPVGYLLLPLLFLLGMFRAQTQGREMYDANEILKEAQEGTNGGSRLRGRVILWERKETEEGVTYVLTLDGLSIGDEALPGQARVYTAKKADIGNRIEVNGAVDVYTKAKNPRGFDGFTYYGYRGVYYNVYEGRMESQRCAHTIADRIKENILRLRIHLSQALKEISPVDVYGFFQGILLGEKDSMEEEKRDSLRRAGLAHILTVSGLHISLLGSLLLSFLKKIRVSFFLRLVLSAILIGGYVYLTEARYPSLRAYDMFLLMTIARFLGRTYDGKCALAGCFLYRTIQLPLLLFDPGFQLSFLSMTAILFFVPHVQALWIRNKEEQKKRLSKIRAALLTSWTVLVVISPVICIAYYETARYAMFLNLLVLPMMGVLLFCLVLGLALFVMLAPFSSVLCRIALGPAVWIARAVLRLSQVFEALPANVCVTGRPQNTELLLYIVFYGGGLILLCLASRLEGFGRTQSRKTGIAYRPDRRGFRMMLFLLLMISGLMIPNALKRRAPVCMELTMLDVGQGDGFIFRFPNGENLVIDCGNNFRDDLWEHVIEPAFLYYGMDTVDAWLLTHFDMDHISGFVQMHKEAEDRRLIRCRRVLISEADAIDTLADLCGSVPEGVIHTLTAGDTFRIGGAMAYCVFPHPGFPSTSENDASVVLRIEYGEYRLLFCGDISETAERWLIARGTDLSADVLKVAHHGSPHSSCDAFVDTVAPKIALISVGKNNYGHPSPDVLTRLSLADSEVQMTNNKGAILLRFKGVNRIETSLP